jgi:hypothetical protein
MQLVRSLQAQDLPEEGEGSGSVSLKKVFQFLHQVHSHFLSIAGNSGLFSFSLLL